MKVEAGLGAALRRAIRALRDELGDPVAPIVVITTAGPNGVLARRALALEEPILRVWFETPDGLLAAQTPVTFWRDLDPEPAGWLRVTLASLVEPLAASGALGRYGPQLRRPGWRAPLASALVRLEGEGVTAADLRALAVDGDLRERTELLATLLEALATERRRVSIAPPSAVVDAAIRAIEATRANGGTGASLARGAVLVGDKELPYGRFTFLERWLAGRPVVRLELPGSAGLLAAPFGITAAAPHARTERVDPASPPALRALQDHLFRAFEAPAADDTSVVFARTPDDVREPAECVRVVQRAVFEGTPLDRIAIVLADRRQRSALEEALDRAELPRTWFAGLPARDLTPARLLRVAVDVAAGDETPRRVFELLSHPALDLRRALGPGAVAGRGRWRRLLSVIRGARGLERIIAGLERLHVDASQPAEEQAREMTARTALLTSLRALAESLDVLRATGPLGAHAAAWIGLLQRFGRKTEARSQLVTLLEPYARGRSGPPLSTARAREELAAILDVEIASGTLTERSIRVLAPMQLAGAELDVVCVLGLTEGRFPSPAEEDPLLLDALLDALSKALGRELPRAKAHEALERRRFAAPVGAARRLLWLSSPAIDFATERPLLPSSHALAALSAVLGRRATFADLARHQVRAGSRARPFPEIAEDALGPAEHLLARAPKRPKGGSSADPQGTLPVLATHPTSRGLLELHRAMTRVRQGGALDAWTGLVPPDVLATPGLDGEPVSLGLLVALLDAPARLFFRHLLGAYRAPPLELFRHPLEDGALVDLLVRVAARETFAGRDLAEALVARAGLELDEGLALGAFRREELGEARPRLAELAGQLAHSARDLLTAPIDAEPTRLADDLPWHAAPLRGRLVGRVLFDVVAKVEHKTRVARDQPALALSALAHAAARRSIDELVALSPTDAGREAFGDFAEVRLDELRAATARARAGQHPMRGEDAFVLAGDRVEAPAGDEDEDEDEGEEEA